MELRVLNYFLMAAREENITRAASLLHVTQPTLSRQLMQLEEELGVKLFERSSHSIILTDEGMLLKRRAQELLRLAEKTKREVSHEEESIIGEIAIGSGELRSSGCLAELLSSFREKYPMVQYDIFSGNADNIKDRMEQGLLDMGLLLEPVDIGKYEFIRMPLKEEWGILVRKDFPLAQKKAVRPEDLIGRPLMASGRGLVQNELANWFGEYADQIDIFSTHNLLYNTAMMVDKGAGEALTLRLESSYDNLCFVPLSPGLETGSVLAWKKNQVFSPATAAFIRHVKKCIRKEPMGEEA